MTELSLPEGELHQVDMKLPAKVDPDAKQSMEEEVERKKTLLKKILQERVSKTHEEMQALNQIRRDLEKLDSLIDQDVVILRQKIDVVATEVSQAQAQLSKKEKEYMQAKQLYEKKFNEKKMLADHLALIIFENEKKKEQKLAEMMGRLAVTDSNFGGWEGFKEEAPS